ncbi:methyltransferase domain protein [Rhizoctonia solani]|uniref:Methyltransferase domain protein n=1 Tax=Rhizoctonia solani TaxID=456999 RepID=A0A8H8NTE2_9AGAM|nr:methyltransferase domain protein [Rhizoctonia solani]QRW19195.1 methyltransferase domain protein [Rhizoctonia solani]
MELAASSPDICIRHGRQFHKSQSGYGLPNDEREFRRLNLQFRAIKLMAGPKDILDIASGSGLWVIELAHEFPQARVIGVDISSPGISNHDIPGNASFFRRHQYVLATIVSNSKLICIQAEGIPFGDSSFDVVQMRIVPSITERTSIYQEIHRVLRPGGIIQLVELSPPISRTGKRPPALDEADQAVARGGYMHDEDKDKAPFDSDGKPKKIGVPIGVWATDKVGQEAGQLMQRQTIELFNGFRPNLIDIGRMDESEVDDIILRLAKELEDGSKWQLETLYDFVWAVRA